jgi:hypothetical protein
MPHRDEPTRGELVNRTRNELVGLMPDPIPFHSKEEVEGLTIDRAMEVLAAARRKLVDELLSQESHPHMLDDCGDYLAAATDNWTRLFNAYFLNDGDEMAVVQAVQAFLSEPEEEWGGSDGEIRFNLLPFAVTDYNEGV